jgi:hypothetical protein
MDFALKSLFLQPKGGAFRFPWRISIYLRMPYRGPSGRWRFAI